MPRLRCESVWTNDGGGNGRDGGVSEIPVRLIVGIASQSRLCQGKETLSCIYEGSMLGVGLKPVPPPPTARALFLHSITKPSERPLIRSFSTRISMQVGD